MSTANGPIGAAIKVFTNLDSRPKLPYCTGTFPWDKEKSTLFYKGESTFLNFPATQSQLESLSNACSAGTFDHGDFGTSFSPCAQGLVDILEDGPFQAKAKNIKAELSRLNVYGPGGSSKAHLVVPSSMAGSLVVILPTVHEGGSLVLRRGKKKWDFDTSEAINTTPSAQAAFIASYHDVKHEVKTVTSGYLITLTYNLYLKKGGKKNVTLTSEQESTEPELKEALDRLLKDPAFFPGGGFIGFGLSQKYPFVVESTKLSAIKKSLKGSDATIQRACEGLPLGVSIEAVHFDEDEPERAMLFDNPSNCDFAVESASEYLIDYVGARAVVECQKDGTFKSYHGEDPIAWLRRLKNTNDFTFHYVLQDYKRPSMENAKATLCLVARIPPAQERGLPPSLDATISNGPKDQQLEDGSGPQKKRRRLE